MAGTGRTRARDKVDIHAGRHVRCVRWGRMTVRPLERGLVSYHRWMSPHDWLASLPAARRHRPARPVGWVVPGAAVVVVPEAESSPSGSGSPPDPPQAATMATTITSTSVRFHMIHSLRRVGEDSLARL